jgi:hypothetical protein
MAEPETEQLVASRMGVVAGFASKLRENAFNSVKEASGGQSRPPKRIQHICRETEASRPGAAPAGVLRHPTRQRSRQFGRRGADACYPPTRTLCCRPSPGPS